MRKILLSSLMMPLLAACWNPSFMPAGYKYHHNTYKSPPGPEAPDIGYKYSEEENEKHLTAWRHALRDLILQTRAQGWELPQQVNLTTDLSDTVFKNTYDYVLREGLRSYGHTLSDEGVELFYSAHDPASDISGHPTTGPDYNAQEEKTDEDYKLLTANEKPMELIIGIIEGGVLTKEVRGTYNLPMDGYVPGAYVQMHEHPLKQHPTKICPVLNCSNLNE